MFHSPADSNCFETDIIWFQSQIAAYNEKVEPVELAAQDIVTHYTDVSDKQDFYVGDQV